MKIRRLLSAALLSAVLPLTASACGVCVEDKVAATYDYAVVAKAARNRQTVAFFEITGLASQAAPSRQRLLSTVEKTRGVERGSVRISLDQAAVSFAVNADRYPLAEVKKLIEQKLSPQHLGLKLLRTLYKGNLSSGES